ncbi:MAG: class I SAM-dependent methyltransferase [Rhodovibrionaceae bacterium]
MSEQRDGGSGRNGYEGFFTGLSLDLWRQATSEDQSEAEAAFLAEIFGNPDAGGGTELLDTPCGNGRHARRLAALGYGVTAADLSEEFLAEGRELAARDGVAIDWQLRDMADLPWPERFAGAYCLGNSFGYRDHAGMLDYLKAVAAALKPGGRFVLDNAMSAESLLPNLEERVWAEVGDIILLAQNDYVPEESRLDTCFTFVRDGAVEERNVSHWIFTVAEQHRMLETAGFKVLEFFANVAGSPFEAGSPELVLVAEKSK